MRFHLVDHILEVQPGRSIRAVKNLTLGEEYLADHFPRFPVMPGVLMLQTLVEAASWLWRITDDFHYSVVVLREVKNVKYGTFMDPGKQMIVTAEMAEQKGSLATFKGKGEAAGSTTVSARFVLERSTLEQRNPAWRDRDQRLAQHLRSLCELLRGDVTTNPAATAEASAGKGV